MKKILTLILAFCCVLLVGCGTSNTAKVANNLGRNISSLKNSVKASATFNKEHISIPQTFQQMQSNTDYQTGTINNYNTPIQTNTSSQRYLMRRTSGEMPIDTYVSDANVPTYRTSTAYYKPRYGTRLSTDKLGNYVERVSDLYSICEDTVIANDLFESLKQSLIKDCDSCLSLLDIIKGLNISKDQCNAVNEYCGVVSGCVNTINNNCTDNAITETSAINNLKNNIGSNTDKLSAKYLKVLDNIDSSMSTITSVQTTINQIKDYLMLLAGKTSGATITNQNTINNTNKYNNNNVVTPSDNILLDRNNVTTYPNNNGVNVYRNNTNNVIRNDELINTNYDTTINNGNTGVRRDRISNNDLQKPIRRSDTNILPPAKPVPYIANTNNTANDLLNNSDKTITNDRNNVLTELDKNTVNNSISGKITNYNSTNQNDTTLNNTKTGSRIISSENSLNDNVNTNINNTSKAFNNSTKVITNSNANSASNNQITKIA